MYHPADRLRNFQASKNSFFRKKWRTGHHPGLFATGQRSKKGDACESEIPFRTSRPSPATGRNSAIPFFH
ncbi:MAG: hypothetical protein C6W56_00200 [Caldibacillus debilis]|nr:hypothetical protein [Bacillaceae bacterium]REJ31187.1 MAG: hypothetical protein C6W56_00200 [Caldibacillus debilis]